jgi:FlaA1/EpsC-like NDP-sugar epimerase
MNKNILHLIKRNKELFDLDVHNYEEQITDAIHTSSFLILGGAGSIGQAVVKEIFKRDPKSLDVVDISENNLVELVRDLRSSVGYITGSFRTFALDIGSVEFDAFMKQATGYDYVLNLSALKHVRSEKDPYTLMRMIQVNIFNTESSIHQSINTGAKKYFCISTDKATNPVNMMGASKRIMEMFLMKESLNIPISTARFANVAFSDGSLLHGFNQRLMKEQPIVAPSDVKRYFVTPKESGQLCLLSCLFGNNRDIFFPKLNEELHLITFKEIAEAFLLSRGFQPHICSSEEEARALASSLPKKDAWPCFFSPSDTTGEKDFEEFFSTNETLDLKTFVNIGIIKNDPLFDKSKLDDFKLKVNAMRSENNWNKDELLNFFQDLLPNFEHIDTGKYLDAKM